MRFPSPFTSVRCVTLSVVIGLMGATLQAQTLTSHYTLDGNGTDSGSVAVDGTLFGSAAFGSSGSGVGIFDKALSTADGTNDYFTAATGGKTEFGVSAITIALWVNIDSGANNDRLVSNLTTTSGFDFSINNYSANGGGAGVDSYNLAFGFNSTSGAVQSSSAKYVTDKWLFLAVTYDSSILSGDNVSFYSGDLTTGVSLNSTSAKSGSIAASASALEIGGTPATGTDRSPAALFNDVRIYNDVLTDVQLESLRAGALIPEPSQYALIFGLMSVGAITMRHNRRRR
jgi:hypothetical protein